MSIPTVVRVLAIVAALLLLAAGAVLGYIAAIALRRNEGVFVPAGYVALACIVAGVLLLRVVRA
jgi:hypothetical protein